MADWKGAVQDSGKEEWWTPQYIIEACRRTMGGIDLDPASAACQIMATYLKRLANPTS